MSLLAKQEFAVPRVIARVNHPKNEWLFNETLGRRPLGVDPAPHHRARRRGGERRAARAAVPARGRPGARSSRSPSPTTPRSRTRRSATSTCPRDATLVAIVRDDHVVMARGDTTLLPGDEVLALVTPESEEPVRRMLTGG